MKRLGVRWSAQAARNLQEIVGRIAVDSPSRARKLAQRLLRRAARLGAFPSSGRKVPELQDQSPPPRELIIGQYRVLYRTGAGEVEIVTVVHARRLLPPV